MDASFHPSPTVFMLHSGGGPSGTCRVEVVPVSILIGDVAIGLIPA
jgi:hypothetical protein